MGGDILGFDKSYFLIAKKTIHNISLVSNKTDYVWDNLFYKSLYDSKE